MPASVAHRGRVANSHSSFRVCDLQLLPCFAAFTGHSQGLDQACTQHTIFSPSGNAGGMAAASSPCGVDFVENASREIRQGFVVAIQVCAGKNALQAAPSEQKGVAKAGAKPQSLFSFNNTISQRCRRFRHAHAVGEWHRRGRNRKSCRRVQRWRRTRQPRGCGSWFDR